LIELSISFVFENLNLPDFQSFVYEILCLCYDETNV
jgi:hypothetical protein